MTELSAQNGTQNSTRVPLAVCEANKPARVTRKCWRDMKARDSDCVRLLSEKGASEWKVLDRAREVASSPIDQCAFSTSLEPAYKLRGHEIARLQFGDPGKWPRHPKIAFWKLPEVDKPPMELSWRSALTVGEQLWLFLYECQEQQQTIERTDPETGKNLDCKYLRSDHQVLCEYVENQQVRVKNPATHYLETWPLLRLVFWNDRRFFDQSLKIVHLCGDRRCCNCMHLTLDTIPVSRAACGPDEWCQHEVKCVLFGPQHPSAFKEVECRTCNICKTTFAEISGFVEHMQVAHSHESPTTTVVERHAEPLFAECRQHEGSNCLRYSTSPSADKRLLSRSAKMDTKPLANEMGHQLFRVNRIGPAAPRRALAEVDPPFTVYGDNPGSTARQYFYNARGKLVPELTGSENLKYEHFKTWSFY